MFTILGGAALLIFVVWMMHHILRNIEDNGMASIALTFVLVAILYTIFSPASIFTSAFWFL